MSTINLNYLLVGQLLFYSLFISNNSYSKESKSSDQLFSEIRPAIFQVKTSKDAEAPKHSYGTGFLVSNDGFLITNFHVVSGALQDEDGEYKIFVVDGEKNIPAKIINFSTIYDLALIKIEKKFPIKLTINPTPPERGEIIYSLGLPQDLKMSIVDGNYNGTIVSGVYERQLMSTPLNSGMSGGPTVNEKGEVVGVNVSVFVDGNSISFSVPAKKILDLMNEKIQERNFLDKNFLDTFVENQILSIQDSLIKDMKEESKSNNTLGRWSFAPPSSSLKCWSSNKKVKKSYLRVNSQSCFLKDAAYVKSDLYLGSYQLSFYNVDNVNLNSIQFFNKLFSMLNYNSDWYNSFLSYFNSSEDSTEFGCNDKVVVNKNNIPFKLTYCINGLVRYSKLYNLHFKIVSLLKDKEAFILKAKAKGFNKDNIFKFMKYQVDSISYNKD